MEAPIIHSIRRESGVAGQFAYHVKVEYPGEGISSVTFVGSVYGAPIVMVTPSGQTFVRRPDLGSELSPAWIRAFFGIGE